MTFRGVFGGLLALTFMQAVLSSTKSAERTAGVWSAVTSGFAHFMSPTVAAIPDIRDRKKWDTVAPGPDGKVPYAPSSNTLPNDWTTKPQAPAAPASAYV
jgi:hypothetical protein